MMSNTKLGEITDRSACAVWSPESGYGSLVALGTKDSGGVSFDQQTGGALEIYDTEKDEFVCNLATATRFSSLLWVSATEKYPAGLIIGGMADGMIQVWNVEALLEDTDAMVGSISLGASSSVTALAASPMEKQKIGVGNTKGQIGIIDLSIHPLQVQDPAPGHPHKSAAVTAVGWNSQVAHIVATGSADGTVSVWDLNAGKAWCEIATGTAVADLHWDPSKGLFLITASAEDRNPVLLLWDLRSSTSMPLATLTGHHSGILKTAWCPHDDALLMSCSRDQRTILWDLSSLRPLADLPLSQANNSSQQQQSQRDADPSALFASKSLNDQHLMRYSVDWSPIKRGVVLTCSLDRKVEIHTVMALATKAGRPPAWMTPKSFVSTGFGGMLIASEANKYVAVKCVSEDKALVDRAVSTETDLAYSSPADYSATKPGHPWDFLTLIFANNARQELLRHLNLDPDDVAKAAELLCEEISNSSEHSVKAEKLPPRPPSKTRGMETRISEVVEKAIVVGNFEAAVNCCFEAGNFSDALLLASCGGAELWSSTQQRYIGRMKSSSHISIARAVMKPGGLHEWVPQADLAQWQHVLAVLATYGQSDEFPQLCTMLGDRLYEANQPEAATECYICALNLSGAVKYWKIQQEKNQISLEEFCLRVYILLQASPSTPLPSEASGIFFEHANTLAQQGLLATAAKYSTFGGDATDSKELRDRLYRSRASPRCLAAMQNNAPEYPYSMMNLDKSAGQVLASYLQEQQQQSAAEDHYGQQQQQQEQTQEQDDYQGTQQAAAIQPDPLPPGWIALQDPSTGQTYYANENTGETTWDRPPPAVSQQQQQQYEQNDDSMRVNGASQPQFRGNSLVSKYGDGFVSSASHPELGLQYGNVGTTNPYGGGRPGPAHVQSGQKAPVSGTLNFDSMELTTELQQVKDSFLALSNALKDNAQLNPVEKRQLLEAEKGIAILVKKMARGDLAEDTTSSVYSLVGAINNSDLASASSVQTYLANHDWREHKDWLKGIKVLIQLALKKFT